jgi:hypothetical protein
MSVKAARPVARRDALMDFRARIARPLVHGDYGRARIQSHLDRRT